MSQTILIQNNKDLRNLYAINLNTYVGTDVIERVNAEDAINLLEILPSINLIITDAMVENEASAITLYDYLQSKNLEIPLIVLGECQKLNDKALILSENSPWELLVKVAGKTLGVTLEDISKKIKPDYAPVQIYYFYEIQETPCDVYIRIQKSPTDVQFVKRLHSQDQFDHDDIAKYEQQGLKFFYVERDYQQYFVTFVTNQLLKKLEDQNITLVDRIHTTANSFDVAGDYIRNFGLDENIIELADASIQSMVESVNQSPKLANLLKLLLSSKISYAYQHAHLVTVIGDFILSKQKWYDKKLLNIFTFVAFFSDITLKSVDQIRVNSQDDLNQSKLDEEEKEEVTYHAIEAANLIKSHPSFSETIGQIVTQHQGSMDGIGFPAEPEKNLHPASKVFIVADAFVKIMLDPNGPRNKKDILTILYAQFSDKSFQEFIKVLEQKID